jgi:hypothetical protein
MTLVFMANFSRISVVLWESSRGTRVLDARYAFMRKLSLLLLFLIPAQGLCQQHEPDYRSRTV